jgi:hypothetical protein
VSREQGEKDFGAAAFVRGRMRTTEGIRETRRQEVDWRMEAE